MKMKLTTLKGSNKKCSRKLNSQKKKGVLFLRCLFLCLFVVLKDRISLVSPSLASSSGTQWKYRGACLVWEVMGLRTRSSERTLPMYLMSFTNGGEKKKKT